MAIHHLTPPVRGGERPRSPSTQVGPVTQAIRAMRAAEPATDEAIAAIREGVMSFLAERIERDIALFDLLDGDCDLELDLADGPEGGDERETDPAEQGIGDYDGLAEQVGFALAWRAYA